VRIMAMQSLLDQNEMPNLQRQILLEPANFA